MTQEEYVLILKQTIDILDESSYWLRRSYNICQKIGVKGDHSDAYSEAEFDAFETLTSRFARTSDMIIQKVFRAIDRLEFEDQGTLIDAVNRAHKRGLIPATETIRDIRELRNDIVHEYIKAALQGLFKDVLAQTEQIFTLIGNIKSYCKKYLNS